MKSLLNTKEEDTWISVPLDPVKIIYRTSKT